MSAREICERILIKTTTGEDKYRVRYPKTWKIDGGEIKQAIGASLMLRRVNDSFDEDGTIADLIEKYGLNKQIESNLSLSSIKDESNKSSTVDDDETENDKKAKNKKSKRAKQPIDEEDGSPKKKKKAECVVEANRGVSDAIREMAGIYFKNGEARAGGVYSKAAKAIREAEFEIKTEKQALSLKGE